MLRLLLEKLTSKAFTEESMGIVSTIEKLISDSFPFRKSTALVHYGNMVNLSLSDRSREHILSVPTL